jgi:hypothetical protein
MLVHHRSSMIDHLVGVVWQSENDHTGTGGTYFYSARRSLMNSSRSRA